MNKSEQILKSRAAEYGSYADNVALYARYKYDLRVSYAPKLVNSKLIMRKLEHAEDLTISLAALKLARLKPNLSKEAIEDTVRDFFNYCYLLVDYIFSFSECGNLDLKFISKEVIKDQLEFYLITDMLSILTSKSYGAYNYKQILEYADLVLKEIQ